MANIYTLMEIHMKVIGKKTSKTVEELTFMEILRVSMWEIGKKAKNMVEEK